VLAPTLTLGINARQSGLACDAIHMQSLQQNLDEIDYWVKWLAARQPGPVVLVGHSYGSLELLAWLATRPHPRVRMLITTSLSYADGFNPPALVKRQVAEARRAVREGDDRPRRFTLSYCKGNFVSPPRVYLSYLRWNAAGARLEVIEGASHFFDAEHEFDLNDAVISRVDRLTP